MFRAAFHTGYVPCGVLRLTKQQLDGACADDRFHQASVSCVCCEPLLLMFWGTHDNCGRKARAGGSRYSRAPKLLYRE